MINSISSWAKSIVLAIIIGTILEMILPEGNNKKYIKTVIGIYVLFSIISPIISKLNGGNLNIDTSQYENYLNGNSTVTASTNSINMSLDSAYISNIKSDIKSRLKEKGYEVKQINADIELKDEPKYGTIKKLDLNLTKIEDDSNVNTVEKVIINISGKQDDTKENTITEGEKAELKKYLKETYDISEKNIDIGG